VGTGYFDAVTTTIEANASTAGAEGFDEDEQFFDEKKAARSPATEGSPRATAFFPAWPCAAVLSGYVALDPMSDSTGGDRRFDASMLTERCPDAAGRASCIRQRETSTRTSSGKSRRSSPNARAAPCTGFVAPA
jgi:hypothetical protein